MLKTIEVKNLDNIIQIEILPCNREKLYIDSPIPLQTLVNDIMIKCKVKSPNLQFSEYIQQFWYLLVKKAPVRKTRPYLPYYLCSEDSVKCACDASIPLKIIPCSEFCVLYWNIIIIPTFNITYGFDESKLVIGFPKTGNLEDEQEDLTSQLKSQDVKDMDLKRKAIEVDKRLFKMNGIINEKDKVLIKYLKDKF